MEYNTNIKEQWSNYNYASNELSKGLRTNNIVGEYAELIVNKHLKGKLLDISQKSADIKDDKGITFQVKARKLDKLKSTQLSIIRSWEFDFLIVVLFDMKGEILIAIKTPQKVAKEHSKKNGYQGGDVISTNQKFLYDKRNINITDDLKNL